MGRRFCQISGDTLTLPAVDLTHRFSYGKYLLRWCSRSIENGGCNFVYMVRNTERNNQKASEFETKSLLYLMAVDCDADEIAFLFIDCFNDVTGANNGCSSLWDVQSKGVSSLRPKTLGASLVTLFQNHQSALPLSGSILFIPKLKEGHLVDESLGAFGLDNVQTKKQSKLREGLAEEYASREGLVEATTEVEAAMDSFLACVRFVVAIQESEGYVRDIVEFKDKGIKSDELYREIFREIRDRQTALKNICIEGKTIFSPADMLEFGKHFKKSEITILVINRLVGMDLFSTDAVPVSYTVELDGMDLDDRKDLLQLNHESLARTLFDKSNRSAFWWLLEEIVRITKDSPDIEPRELRNQLPSDLIASVHALDEQSVLFLISLIKDGLSNAA